MSKHHLLLVDSDAKSLRVTEVSLKNAGFSVATAVNGADALDKISLSAPDLVISETRMPEMDGFELVKRLKQDKRFSAIPFVFLSNDKSVTDKVRGLELGVDDYLQRPIYIKEIITRINLLLQRRENEQLERKDPKASGFSGNLSEMGLVDLLQTFEIGRKSGQVRIQLGDRSANLWFRDGKIVDVEVGALAGEAAFYRLLTYGEGLFFIEFHPIDRPDRLPLSSQALLLEGMRRLEERNRILDQLPPLATVFDVDYKLLPEKLPTLPDEVNGILRLFDGRRTLQQVIEESTFDDVPALSIIRRLYQQGLLVDVSQHASKPAGDAQSAEEIGRWARQPTPPPTSASAAAPPAAAPAREAEPAWFEPPTEGLSAVDVQPGAAGSSAHAPVPRPGHRIEEHSSFEGFDGPTPPSARRVPVPAGGEAQNPYRQTLPSSPQASAAAAESIATVVRFPSRRTEAENPASARAVLPAFPTEPPPREPAPPPVLHPHLQREAMPGRPPSGAIQLRNGTEARTDSGFRQAAAQSISMPAAQPRGSDTQEPSQHEGFEGSPAGIPAAPRPQTRSSARVSPRNPVSAEEAADLSAIRKRRRPPYLLAGVLILIAVFAYWYFFFPSAPPPATQPSATAAAAAHPAAPAPAAAAPAAPVQAPAAATPEPAAANAAQQPTPPAPAQAAPSAPAPAVAAAPTPAPAAPGAAEAAPAQAPAAAAQPAAGQPEPAAAKPPEAPAGALGGAQNGTQAEAQAVPSDKAYDDALQRGQELYKEGSVRAAADEFKKAAAAKPDADTPLVAMGSTLFELNETDQALVFIKKALAINPNNSRAYLTLGTIYQTMNKRADAAAAYRKYLQLAPDGEFAKDVKHILPALARSRR